MFASNRDDLESVYKQSVESGNLTLIMEKTAKEFKLQLERDYLRIKNRTYTSNVPQSFFHLTDRQKEIVVMMDRPQSSVTNRQVQKEFGISQITASRDLARLTTLGILYPQGRGRSVHYTKL
jgi:predicted HTH transcriptional regulator